MSHLIKKAVVIGATGLVGKYLVYALHHVESCTHIRVFVRQENADFKHLPKVQQIVYTDLGLVTEQDVSGFSHAFSCLGTTLKKAGSKSAFYHVDSEMNLHFAKMLMTSDIHLIFVSALGADRKSQFFYNRVKGQLEDDVKKIAFN